MCIVASIKKGQKKDVNVEFYGNYANYVSNCLRKPIFQRFLKWVMKREKIQKGKIRNVQIRMFPTIEENGNFLIGKCNSKGEVFLYPKKIGACKKKRQRISSECLLGYIQGRAMASLIHELLHLKYGSNEEKVKELTKKYYSIFHSNNDSKPLDFKKHQAMVFNY